MIEKQNWSAILNGEIQLGKYPMERLKHVEKPTIKITDTIERYDERNHAIAKDHRGELGNTDGLLKQGKDQIGQSLMTRFFSFPQVDDEIYDKQDIVNDPAILSRHIKSLGYFLKADIMSISPLPQWAVYSYNMDGEPNEVTDTRAICITVDQGYKTMEGSRGDDWISFSQSHVAYTTSAFISFLIADYIRRLGFHAHVNHALNYQVIVTPLLVLSGVGEMCRAGVALNPFLGFRFKTAVVTTDMPLETDKPIDFGLQKFCDVCKKCARECPSHSISSGDKIMQNGYETWEFKHDTCGKYRIGNKKGAMCGRCIKVCPFNKPEGLSHDLVRGLIQNVPALDGVIARMDDVWGYGKTDPRKKWWFDI
jgi:reductive dehalogenase